MEALITWATTSPLSFAATTFSAISSLNQGNNQSANYESQAQANAYNAAVARQNAQIAAEQGNANEEAQRRNARVIKGQQRAAIAEAGIGTGGTGSDLVEQSARYSELDALNIRYGAQLQSVGFANQAGLDDWQARQNRRNASTAKTAGLINAGAAALSGYGGYRANENLINNAGKGTL